MDIAIHFQYVFTLWFSKFNFRTSAQFNQQRNTFTSCFSEVTARELEGKFIKEFKGISPRKFLGYENVALSSLFYK